MKKLGISISAYDGCENYLTELFSSLEEVQSKGDLLEVMLMDNASSNPEIWRRIVDFAKGKEYIKIKQFTENNGKKQATWYALNNLESKYVQVLDHDDFLITKNVERVIEILYEQNPDIAFLTYPYFSDKKKKITSTRKIVKSKFDFENVKNLPKTLWHFDTNTILNRELMMENGFQFPESVTRYEDVYINMWNLQFSKKITLIDLPIYSYRIHVPNQLSSTTSMMKNFNQYKNTVIELSKLDFTNVITHKNMNYIYALNYLSFSYFNSISESNRKEVKKRFKELKNTTKSNKIKVGMIGFLTDVITLRRKNYFLILMNKIVLIFRK